MVDQFHSPAHSVLLPNPIPECGRPPVHLWIARRVRDCFREPGCGQVLEGNWCETGSELCNAPSPERLVSEEGADYCRLSGAQAGCGSAGATVMNDGGDRWK
jgi:hypothetical protein